MKLEPNTKAFKAYEKGKYAGLIKQDIRDNPYLGKRYIGLSNWWVKGYSECLKNMVN
jgi:hypothetical protein